MIRLLARRELAYAGRSIPQGHLFDVPPIVAAALVYQGQAAFASGSEPVLSGKKRRTYKRRDLLAED